MIQSQNVFNVRNDVFKIENIQNAERFTYDVCIAGYVLIRPVLEFKATANIVQVDIIPELLKSAM